MGRQRYGSLQDCALCIGHVLAAVDVPAVHSMMPDHWQMPCPVSACTSGCHNAWLCCAPPNQPLVMLSGMPDTAAGAVGVELHSRTDPARSPAAATQHSPSRAVLHAIGILLVAAGCVQVVVVEARTHTPLCSICSMHQHRAPSGKMHATVFRAVLPAHGHCTAELSAAQRWCNGHDTGTTECEGHACLIVYLVGSVVGLQSRLTGLASPSYSPLYVVDRGRLWIMGGRCEPVMMAQARLDEADCFL